MTSALSSGLSSSLVDTTTDITNLQIKIFACVTRECCLCDGLLPLSKESAFPLALPSHETHVEEHAETLRWRDLQHGPTVCGLTRVNKACESSRNILVDVLSFGTTVSLFQSQTDVVEFVQQEVSSFNVTDKKRRCV